MTTTMTDAKKVLDAEALRFITDEGQFTFVRLSPPTEPDNFGAWGYNLDIAWPANAENKSFKNALATLVESVTGERKVPKGIIKTLEETARDAEKNASLKGKIFTSFKKRCNPKDHNLSDPAIRRDWIKYVGTESPGLFKLNEKGERSPASAGDIFSGCFGKVVGHCYYNEQYKKYCVTMEYVILTRQGDRLSGSGPVDPKHDKLLNQAFPEAKDDIDQVIDGASELSDEELPF